MVKQGTVGGRGDIPWFFKGVKRPTLIGALGATGVRVAQGPPTPARGDSGITNHLTTTKTSWTTTFGQGGRQWLFRRELGHEPRRGLHEVAGSGASTPHPSWVRIIASWVHPSSGCHCPYYQGHHRPFLHNHPPNPLHTHHVGAMLSLNTPWQYTVTTMCVWGGGGGGLPPGEH